MDEQVLGTKSMRLSRIIRITAQEIYIHKLTSLHLPEHSVVQGLADFPAISTKSQSKSHSLMRKNNDKQNIGV